MKIKRMKRHHLRDVYPVKYYSNEGFVETKLEIHDDDLAEIIEYYIFEGMGEITYFLTYIYVKIGTIP